METRKPDEDGLEEKKQGAGAKDAAGEATGVHVAEPTTLPAEFVPAEINIEALGFFDATYKRRYPGRELKNRKGEVVAVVPTEKVIQLGGERAVRFIPSAKYGYANAEDQDFYRALLEICDEQIERVEGTLPDGRHGVFFVLPQPLTFSTRDLLRKCGREKGNQRKAVREWIARNHSTAIHGSFKVASPDGVSVRVIAGTEPLIRKFYCVGDEMGEGKVAEKNQVWFGEWFLENFKYGYIKSLDAALHHRLHAPIAKGLYPILDQGWYASRGNPYSKRYAELAKLLTLTPVSYLAHLKKQLDPALEELQRERFLERWEYRRSSDDRDFVVTFWPGPKFAEDREARKGRRELAERIEEVSRRSEKESGGPPSPEEEYLLKLILDETGPRDEHSRPYYLKLIREIQPPVRIWMLISETRQARQQGRIKTTPARYFTDLAERELARQRGEPAANAGPRKTSS